VSERAETGQVAHEVADHLLHGVRDVAAERDAAPAEPVAFDRHDTSADRERLHQQTELTALRLGEIAALDGDHASSALDAEHDPSASAEAATFHANARTIRRQRSASAPGRKGRYKATRSSTPA